MSPDIRRTDCLDPELGLPSIPTGTVDMVLTDPPYFIDGMDDNWDASDLEARTAKHGVIGSLPVGMKFDRNQGRRFQEFFNNIALESYRILKPGGFLVSFSQARLYHRMAVAVEDADFEIRDMLGWCYEGQAKAFSQAHFVRKMNISPKEKEEILKKLGGRKTPQLKPMIEPMVLAQKPKEGTFINNWLLHEVGLVDTTQTLDGKFPGNIMAVPKPSKAEKGFENIHITVKPVRLIEHLIQLFTKEGATIVDPFLGSGTTAVACALTNRNCIGMEIEKEYHRICLQRAKEAVRKKAESLI